MTRALDYTDDAIGHLEEVFAWMTQHGAGAAATRRLNRITTAVDRLRATPCLFPVGAHPGVREMSVEGHRVLYQVEPDTGRDRDAGDVLILAIFGPGQDRRRFSR